MLVWSRASRVDLRSVIRQAPGEVLVATSLPSFLPAPPTPQPLPLALVRISSIEKGRVLLGQASQPGASIKLQVLGDGAVILVPVPRDSPKTIRVDARGRIQLTSLAIRILGNAPLLVAQPQGCAIVLLLATSALSVSITQELMKELMDNHG